MESDKKGGSLKSRVRSLQRESREVEQNIRSLSRAIKQPSKLERVDKLLNKSASGDGAKSSPSPKFGRSRRVPNRTVASREFAQYMNDKSFKQNRSRPLRQERNLQRNKAIFMLIVVALVAYVVFQLLK